jgi:plasmid stability protein
MTKVIQVRDIPDDVHRRLKLRASEEGQSLSDLIRTELNEIADRPTLSEMLERIGSRDPVSIAESAANAVRSGRGAR